LGAINAINLLDGIDGLAATLGFIMACTIAVMAMIVHAYPVAVVALVFASSLLGFLCFNFPPATIFLGDAGSMLIGLVVGSLAIRGALKGPGTVLLAAPLAVLAIPIFDSLAAILRRKLTGRSIYVTDRGHLHHRLLDLMGSNRKVLLAAAIFCLLTSLGTLLSVSLANDLIALLACSALVIILIATGVFGRAEIALRGLPVGADDRQAAGGPAGNGPPARLAALGIALEPTAGIGGEALVDRDSNGRQRAAVARGFPRLLGAARRQAGRASMAHRDPVVGRGPDNRDLGAVGAKRRGIGV